MGQGLAAPLASAEAQSMNIYDMPTMYGQKHAQLQKGEHRCTSFHRNVFLCKVLACVGGFGSLKYFRSSISLITDV